MESIFTIVEKINIQKGDILIVRINGNKYNIKDLIRPIEHMSEIIKSKGGQVLIVDENINIEHLPENEMEKIGWIKKNDTQ
jgi:hypothetical protein